LRTSEVCETAEVEAGQHHAQAIAAVASLSANLAGRWIECIDRIKELHRRLLSECLEAAETRRQVDLDLVQENRGLMRQAVRELNALPDHSAGGLQTAPSTPPDPPPAGKPDPAVRKLKRGTERGEAREKIIAALCLHHRYEDGSCLNLVPIGNNELARKLGVGPATVSEFFKREFKGHRKYCSTCRETATLVAALKMLRGEYSPHLLYERTPPGEDCHDDD
jgi:hypothetical protein